MSELKPCPFCGKDACYVDTVGIATLHDQDEFGLCSCTNTATCLPTETFFKVEHWQSRPLEDSLSAENAKLREALEKIVYIDAVARNVFMDTGVRSFHDCDEMVKIAEEALK